MNDYLGEEILNEIESQHDAVVSNPEVRSSKQGSKQR